MRHGGDLRIISADYTIRAEWDTAYVVDVTVVVDCDESGPRHRFGLSGWKIDFLLEKDTEISKIWNAHLDRDGTRCTVEHKKFCSPVSRGRAVLYFGFEAKPSELRKSASVPTTLSVNGQVCEVTASYARELADCYYDYVFASRESSRSPSPEPFASSRTPSRSPSPEQRESSLPPATDSALQISPLMCSNKRLRTSSPAADCRDAKKFKTAEDETVPQTDTDEEKSVAQTPPRDFSPISSDENMEVSGQKPWGDARPVGHSRSTTAGVGQCNRLPLKPNNPEDSATNNALPEYPRTLQIEYYRRSKALKQRKFRHMDYLDTCFDSREEVILATVLNRESVVLEPNMFPYDCPPGVTHWTLWSKTWLNEDGITQFVNTWLSNNLPSALEWNHDDNMSDGLSINLFHIHVYIRSPV